MNAKQAQEVRRHFICRGTSSSLPEECVEVVGLDEGRAFPNIKGLDEGLQVKEPPGELQVQF